MAKMKEGIVGNCVLAGLFCILLAVLVMEQGLLPRDGVEVEITPIFLASQNDQLTNR